MKIQHMRKQWISGPSFFFPARSAPRASLRAKKEELGTRLDLHEIRHCLRSVCSCRASLDMEAEAKGLLCRR